MANIRSTISKKNDYWLPKHAFLMAYHYALQYPDWQTELRFLTGEPSAFGGDGMPKATSTESKTESVAIRRAALSGRMDMIEDVAALVAPDIAKWLILGVTRDGVTYNHLRMMAGLPCGKDYYYRARRRFYYELYKRL